MLKNKYLDAKIGVDTAENELWKEWCVVADRRGGGAIDRAYPAAAGPAMAAQLAAQLAGQLTVQLALQLTPDKWDYE